MFQELFQKREGHAKPLSCTHLDGAGTLSQVDDDGDGRAGATRRTTHHSGRAVKAAVKLVGGLGDPATPTEDYYKAQCDLCGFHVCSLLLQTPDDEPSRISRWVSRIAIHAGSVDDETNKTRACFFSPARPSAEALTTAKSDSRFELFSRRTRCGDRPPSCSEWAAAFSALQQGPSGLMIWGPGTRGDLLASESESETAPSPLCRFFLEKIMIKVGRARGRGMLPQPHRAARD